MATMKLDVPGEWGRSYECMPLHTAGTPSRGIEPGTPWWYQLALAQQAAVWLPSKQSFAKLYHPSATRLFAVSFGA